MLCLDGECGGLILGQVVDGPETVEDVQAEMLAEKLLDQLAVAPADHVTYATWSPSW